MSDTTDAELYSLRTNVCKPPKHFDFPEAKQPFSFFDLKSFHGFVILGGRIDHIA